MKVSRGTFGILDKGCGVLQDLASRLLVHASVSFRSEKPIDGAFQRTSCQHIELPQLGAFLVHAALRHYNILFVVFDSFREDVGQAKKSNCPEAGGVGVVRTTRMKLW